MTRFFQKPGFCYTCELPMKIRILSRLSLAIILSLVALTFLTGVLLTFTHAGAARTQNVTLVYQAGSAAQATPTPQKTPVAKSADTTGIIALAIVIVAVILVGATRGRRKPMVKDQLKKE
jgi:hypothetical protein